MDQQFLISILAPLLAFSNYDCASNTEALDSERISKELHETSWQLYSHLDSTRRDTIVFSFGYVNTGGELNLLLYHSKQVKEQCEFRVAKDTIIVDSYSTAPSPLVIEADSCRMTSKLLYSESVLRLISIDTYCGEIHKNINPESLQIKFRRL